MQRFAVGLSLAMAVVGLGLMINVDVPARRLVYLSIPLAVLTGALWDAASRSSAYGENPRMYEIDSRLARVGAIAGCAIAGLIVVGWVVSPNGGLSSFVVPRFSAWLLFDMRAKIAYKLLWLGAGLVAGLLLWRVRARVWANRRSLLACALIAHGAYYVAVSGLWVSRLSYTGLNASKTVGELVPPGSYMLGADAAAQGYFNQTRPLFWSPKVYRFANYDEEAIQRDYNPEFMLLNAVDVARLRDGTFACSPYIASFLEHEVARMPLYEYHESLTLDTELVLFRRAEH